MRVRLEQVLLLFSTVLITRSAPAQVDLDWVRTYGEKDETDQANDLAFDPQGYLYVVGISAHRPTIIKYASNGTTLWTRQHGIGQSGDYTDFSAVAVDPDRNVYATGGDTDINGHFTMITVKYGTDGTLLWERHHDLGGLGSTAKLLALAPDGDLVVVGIVRTPLEDIAVLRYSPEGTLLWMRYYDGSLHLTDWPGGLIVDSSGNSYVTGYSESTTGRDCVTISYGPTGEQRWLRLYDGGLKYGGSDYGGNLALTPDEASLYVVGRTALPFATDKWLTIKYDAEAGDEQWVRFYGMDLDQNGGAADLVVAEDGVVYVTGSADPGGKAEEADLAIVAYGPEGDELWSVRRSQEPGQYESGGYIQFAPDASLVVAGAGTNPEHGYPDLDYIVMGYDRGGTLQWESTYGGPTDLIDIPGGGLIVDDLGNVYASGRITTAPDGYWWDWATVKWRTGPTGVELPSASARQDGCAVVLNWTTADAFLECDLLRYDEPGGEGTQVNQVPLLAVDHRYQFTDNGTMCVSAYRYVFVGTTLQGARMFLGELEIRLTPSIPSLEPPSLAVQRVEPNPTSGGSSIRFTLTKPSSVHFDMYNALGRVVIQRQLDALPAGNHRIALTGSDDRGRTLANGAYYYRFRTPGAPLVSGRVVVAR